MRILVVEDCPMDREIVARWLKEHELVFCESPMQTYSLLLKDTNFDVCLCDYNLPMAIDDKFIKSLRKSTEFPVVAYSGKPNESAPVPKEEKAVIEALTQAVKAND